MTKKLLSLTISLFAAVMICLAAYAQQTGGTEMGNAETVISSWPETAQKAAKMTIQQYGQPTEITPTHLVWENNGPWKRTIVYKEEVAHDFPMPHKDVLEQFVDYRVPADKFDELAEYDGSVIAERTKGEISARCDKEPMNFLALNLANDIVNGKRSVDDARKSYADNVKRFMKGEKPGYTQKLQFNITRAAADPDETTIQKSEVEALKK
jgi:hypothetical protein